MVNKPYPKTGQNQNLLAIFDQIPADRQTLIPEEDTDFCRQLQAQFDNVHDALGKKYDEVRFEAQLLQDYSVDFLPDSKVTYKLPRDKTKRTPFDQFLFLPFESIDKIVYLHDAACRRLCTMITDYFNRKYNLTIPSFNLGSDTLRIDFRPYYENCLRHVLDYLDGKSFQAKAEQEIIGRLLQDLKYYPPALKGATVVFPVTYLFDDFWMKSSTPRCSIAYGKEKIVSDICTAVIMHRSGLLTRSSNDIVGLRSHEVDTSIWYQIQNSKGCEIKFYKNGRIDIRFPSAREALDCFVALKLGTIRKS